MPAHRKPIKILEKTGAFKKNPQRKRSEPKTKGKLGDPPEYFTDPERVVWNDIQDNAPLDVLTNADRLMVEVLARVIAQFRATPTEEIKAAHIQQVRTGLAALGMTPADRSRVAPQVDKKEDNPFSSF